MWYSSKSRTTDEGCGGNTEDVDTHLNAGTLVHCEDLQSGSPSLHGDSIAVPCGSCTAVLRAEEIRGVEGRGLLHGERGIGVRQVDGRTEDPIIDVHKSRVLIADETLEGGAGGFQHCQSRRLMHLS